MMQKNIRPIYSSPWLGRSFKLTENSLAWGRYVITDSALVAADKEKGSYCAFSIKEADPAQLGLVFEHLIHVYCPNSFPDFLRETQALATYCYAREHMRALLSGGCAPDDYYRASIAIVGAFDEALSAVFESSIPLHGLNRVTYIRYRQKLHGMHLTIFSDDQQTYDVAFTSDLVLASIRLADDWNPIWPQFT
ncbi:hypothetical protein ACFQ09_07045 [Massilia norwichensis]|uniref:Uncharacterized protein n=1 Tax=Massilia norwichensis TaxID=1442366 RepID=A0ABT2A945_9BURK|nr:hypothetical protein [Massilia norwichensis]MCS0590709.1 hypothetical protein [Massilia norwichensis]